MADAKMAALGERDEGVAHPFLSVNIAGDVYVSIIPFVKDVNLGGANWNSDWDLLGQYRSGSRLRAQHFCNGVCSNTTYK